MIIKRSGFGLSLIALLYVWWLGRAIFFIARSGFGFSLHSPLAYLTLICSFGLAGQNTSAGNIRSVGTSFLQTLGEAEKLVPLREDLSASGFRKKYFCPNYLPSTSKPRKQPYSPFDHLHTYVKITYHDYNKYKYLSHEHSMALYRYPQVLSCSLPTNQAYSESHP